MAPVLTFVASNHQEDGLQNLYLGAVAFGVTLLVASFLLGGKDTDHGDGGSDGAHADLGLAWAPFGSLRFWVFFFTFGGGAGFALTKLGSSSVIAGVGAGVIGWLAGALAVTVIRSMTKHSASSEVAGSELVGTTGTLLLPASPSAPGKVRVEIEGRKRPAFRFEVDLANPDAVEKAASDCEALAFGIRSYLDDHPTELEPCEVRRREDD